MNVLNGPRLGLRPALGRIVLASVPQQLLLDVTAAVRCFQGPEDKAASGGRKTEANISVDLRQKVKRGKPVVMD